MITIPPAFVAAVVAAKPPVVQGDAEWANVASLLPFDGANDSTTFTDAKSVVWTVTGANVKLTTAQKKFGTASLSLPGGENYLHTTGGFVIGTRQFSLQGWFRCTDTSAITQTIIGNYNASAGDWTLVLTSNGRLEFYESSGGTDLYSTTGVDLRDSAWHYYSITRNAANRVSLSVDGTEQAFATGVASDISYNGDWRIGWNAHLSGFTGQVDDMRLTFDVARPNTVPTSAFPTIG